jgi:simple sugar transport system permease protein
VNAPLAQLTGTLASETVRVTVPYACAALGGVWSEKSGVVNIALEGMMLAGALGAVAVHGATDSPVLGVVFGMSVGAAIGALHAWLVAREVDAIVSGIALNLVAMGGTRFLLRALYGSSSNSPSVRGFSGPFAGSASPALALVDTLSNPLTLAALALLGATSYALRATRFGVRVRAAGEDASSAASLGLDVPGLRLAAVSLGGAIAGLGGAALAFDQHQFQSGMSGGRGFIALAAVILSGSRPGRAVLACAAFAMLDALQIVFQGHSRVSHDLVTTLPYVATLVSLAVLGLRRRRAAPGVSSS